MTVHEALVAINPATGLTIARYPVLSIEEIETRIAGCHQAHQVWSVVQLAQRAEILQQLAHQLERQRDQLAALMTGEMGKPLSQACSEIDKCAWVCRYFAESGQHYLQADDIQLNGAVASVVPRPLGRGSRDHALELSFLAGVSSPCSSLDGGKWGSAQGSLQCARM